MPQAAASGHARSGNVGCAANVLAAGIVRPSIGKITKREDIAKMKTDKRQRLEIIFWSILTGFFGASVGYYWAAATAAEIVRANLK